MGKATIISGGEEGLYKIRVNLHRDNINTTIARLQAEISTLETLVAEIDEQLAQIDAQITALAADPMAQSAKISEHWAVNIKKTTLEIKIKALQRRIAYLEESMPEDPEINAWCADYSEDLTGAVGTVEVPGERGTVIIRPGFESAAHLPARDGVLEPVIAATPEGACYNWAMLPGWQKWKPTHRFGKITLLNELTDRCNLELEDIPSSAQVLQINQTETLSGVPIEYMDGNSEAFEEGDDVLIEFANQDWSTPRVIGFKDHPRDCDFHERFGDNKIPSDYWWRQLPLTQWHSEWIHICWTYSKIIPSYFALDIRVNIPPGLDEADFWPLPAFLCSSQWICTLKNRKKIKQYIVVETSHVQYTKPLSAGSDVVFIVIDFDGAYAGFSAILDHPSVAPQTFVYDFYTIRPSPNPIILPGHKYTFETVSILWMSNRGLSALQYSINIGIDSIRITNNPPPPEESIWL